MDLQIWKSRDFPVQMGVADCPGSSLNADQVYFSCVVELPRLIATQQHGQSDVDVWDFPVTCDDNQAEFLRSIAEPPAGIRAI
mmetsp:Transcript_51105/g.110919  ORF Transcript_51105/g.110919 Transcript_51105/m.110919 type:complete len:83 (-) Transcript_51105:240-488(-)